MTAPTWSNARRKLSALIPWPRNPRQIKGESVRRLQESFEEFGQPEVIAIGPANEVYNGHQRLKSWAAKFGDIEVDVRVASRPLTEKEREQLTVLLHRGAVGEWNFEMLANEFDAGELLEWGFTEMELGLDGAAAEIPESKYKEQYGVIVICAGAEHQERVYNELQEMGLECRVVVT